MSTELLERRFAAIGARVKVAEGPWLGVPRIDVLADGRGEYFDLSFRGGRAVAIEVVDARPEDRHLLLLVRNGVEKSKFLCGHDERHWFVAAVPESVRGVTGVREAKAALQPEVVREAARRVRPKDRLRRRNDAFVRQGEWFFLPVPELRVDERLVLRNERLGRPGGTPHVLEQAFRRGGRTVYLNWQNGRQLTESQFRRLSERQRRGGNWSRQVVDPELYARGAVRHPDHATIELRGWHRVLMNTEQGARAMRYMAFID